MIRGYIWRNVQVVRYRSSLRTSSITSHPINPRRIPRLQTHIPHQSIIQVPLWTVDQIRNPRIRHLDKVTPIRCQRGAKRVPTLCQHHEKKPFKVHARQHLRIKPARIPRIHTHTTRLKIHPRTRFPRGAQHAELVTASALPVRVVADVHLRVRRQQMSLVGTGERAMING
jgi:hypothetical protein